MIDQADGAALAFFAIVFIVIYFVIFPVIVATVLSLLIKLFNRKISTRKLVVIWVLLLILIACCLRLYAYYNVSMQGENILKQPPEIIQVGPFSN